MNLDFLLHWMNVEKYLKSDFEHSRFIFGKIYCWIYGRKFSCKM